MSIVLHPARATRDLPRLGVRKGDRMYHVVSDELGAGGGRELREVCAGCGLRPEWVQFPGTYREHFDVFSRGVECLLATGARLVTNRELGQILAAKREHLRLTGETGER